MLTRARVVAAALDWIGTPFQHQGRTPCGIDCVGLIINVGRDLGATTFDVRGYGPQPDPRVIQAACAEHLRRSDSPDADGTILLFRWLRVPQHFGIKVPGGFVHVYQPDGQCRLTPFSAKWRARVFSQYDYPGVR